MLDFLIEEKFYVHLVFELLAAIAGLVYLWKSKKVKPEIRIFIYYLCYIVLIEFYALLPIYAWLRDYDVLSFYRDSPFRYNHWSANLNFVIYTLCFSQIFIRSLSSKFKRKILFYALGGIVVFSFFRFVTHPDVFFYYSDPYVSALQTFFVFLCVCFYYFEILRSDKVIYFYKDLKFFISVSIVLWSLLKTPLDIYSSFSNLQNEAYWRLDIEILRYLNVFLYSMYILGFYSDYWFKKYGLQEKI
ncbi:MAG: hypothetical protein R3213_13050 [Flavobacteriaceae bacterium]|nr:hypothetical protein [Flavobacteriaceae bacterium]